MSAEEKLWAFIQEKELGGYKFIRQHAVGVYMVGFACVPRKIIVELEKSSHGSSAQVAFDTQRTQYLTDQGWTILSYSNEDIYRSLDSVIDDIYAHLKRKNLP